MAKEDYLVVLWTRGEKDFAENMVFLYTLNARRKGWWKKVTMIVWGPSAKLLAEDEELQAQVRALQAEGVYLQACIRCTDSYGPDVTETLRGLDIEVIKMGEPLTQYLKEATVLSL